MSKGPVTAKALFLEGNRWMSAGDTHAAIQCYERAIALAPDFAEAHANLGMLLDQEGRSAEAERHYRRSISLNPGYGETFMNLGVLLFGQKRFQEAEAAYRLALELTPGNAAAWSNLGCLLLRQGRYEEGWQCFEARDWYARLEKMIPCPRWHGEPLSGRALLIGLEAGHGDMIQFCRYAGILKAQGASRITLLCHPALKTLFKTLDGVDDVFAVDEPIPALEADFWTPPLSVPCYCRTRLDTIPDRIPYLHPDEQRKRRWAAALSEACTPGDVRIGLVWKGNPRFENDADRSLPGLEVLAPLAAVAGVRFFSLQKGQGEAEADHPPQGLRLINLGPGIADFADAAAITANLDLLICVDTAVAHLAGALGKRCWVLLPDYMTDWRWLKDRPDSPWYPRVLRLFRQETMGEWETVIREVQGELLRFVAGARPAKRNESL